MRLDRAEVALLAAGALLSAATIWQGIGPHDEGLMLQAAARVADGQWPYRDFWWNYGPGQPLLLGALTALLGPSLAVWRVVRVVVDAVTGLLAFRLARRGGATPLLALLAWLGVAGALAFPTGPGPNPPALALGLGALLLAPGRPRAAGALAGLAAVVRPELGVAAAIGAGRRSWPWAALVAVLGWLPFALVAPGQLVDQLGGFLGVQGLQRLPFPFGPGNVGLDPNKLLERLFPLVLVLGLAAWAVHAALRRPPLRALALAPLALAGLAYLLGRADEFHQLPLAVALALLLAGAAAREPSRAGRSVLVGALALIALHGLVRKAGEVSGLPALAPVPGPAGDGVRTDAADARALRATLAAIGGRTLFVAPPRFDRVTVGDPLLYVIAARANPTRYDVIQPGVVTTAAVQEEMVRDLQRAPPQVLVRWLDPRTAAEPNGAGRERGARVLDRYLTRTYRPRARFGPYAVLERR